MSMLSLKQVINTTRMQYKNAGDHASEEAMAELARQAQESGMGYRRASSYLSPLSCSQWLNILPSPDRRDDGVAFRVERDGRDVRPVARVA